MMPSLESLNNKFVKFVQAVTQCGMTNVNKTVNGSSP